VSRFAPVGPMCASTEQHVIDSSDDLAIA